jgi:methylmalonyl-CoA mutase N-terminal domain/subunit
MEEAAYRYFEKIESLGGMVEAVKQNFPQSEIADASWRYQKEVDDGKRVVVGVNRYEVSDEEPIEILSIDPALERKQIDRLRAVRDRRDSVAVENSLAKLKLAAADPEHNLMPRLVDCARAYCTQGEMVEALQEVFGTYSESPVF